MTRNATVFHSAGGRRATPRPLLLAAIVTAGLGACSEGPRSAISECDLEGHLAVLGAARLEGRVPGEPGYDSAAAYAVRTLAAAGVRPGVQRKGGGAAFLQAVPLVHNRIGPGTVLELQHARGGTKRLPHDRRTFLLLTGDSSGRTPALPPVFVGNGLYAPEYGVDDFAGLDLKGRGVLVSASHDPKALLHLPEPVQQLYADPKEAQLRRLRAIVERGAAMLLLLPDRWLIDEWDAVSALRNQLDYGPAERYPDETNSPIPAVVLHTDLVDRLFLGRSYHPISHAGTYGSFELTDLTLRLVIDMRREPITTANVIGIVPGTDRRLRSEYVVVTAQLDGAGRAPARYGREDPSAVAALLEAAAALAATPPSRSVLFALFTAEARGGWGSIHFLAHPPVAPEAIAAAIHVAAPGSYAAGADLATAFAVPALRTVAEASAQSLGGERLRVRGPEQEALSKSAAFHAFTEAGIPSLLLESRILSDAKPRPGELRPEEVKRLAALARVLHRLVVEAAADLSEHPAEAAGVRR